MDKFVVRTPRPKPQDKECKSPDKSYKQATIESLQGVVVVEEIWRLKSVLKVENQTSENLKEALQELKKKIPSRAVLKSTKIGHTINRLTKHSDREVSKLANKIVKKWKTHFEEKLDKPMIEVKCDAKTEKLRKAGRKLLAGSMQVLEKDTLPEAIEREAFHQHGRLVNNAYRRSMRSLVFTLKHQTDIRQQVLNKSLEITDFVSQYKKEAKIS